METPAADLLQGTDPNPHSALRGRSCVVRPPQPRHGVAARPFRPPQGSGEVAGPLEPRLGRGAGSLGTCGSGAGGGEARPGLPEARDPLEPSLSAPGVARHGGEERERAGQGAQGPGPVGASPVPRVKPFLAALPAPPPRHFLIFLFFGK